METLNDRIPGLDVLGLRKKALNDSLANNRSRHVVCRTMIEIDNPSFIGILYQGFEKIGSIGLQSEPAEMLSDEFKQALVKELQRLSDIHAAMALRCEQEISGIDQQLNRMATTDGDLDNS